eukprot:TRINITY_DN18813_c0_g1_i1.p1 TRINITY_DN18813_c0_g1~~TRINITY_DN18813_c0_g1_i1.p1  ORF type:complete len:169 (-),score=17.76 TRINITY_DN18813_c0_g1_i1:195-701(-)
MMTDECVPEGGSTTLLLWLLFFDFLISFFIVSTFVGTLYRTLRRRWIQRRITELLAAQNALLPLTTIQQLIDNAGINPDEIAFIERELQLIPTKQVQKEDIGSELKEFQCSICIEDLVEGATIAKLPKCHHTFHKHCIDVWLLKKPTCPNCKQNVRRALAESQEQEMI